MVEIDAHAGFAAFGPRFGAMRTRSEAISRRVSQTRLTIASAQSSLISLLDAGRQVPVSADEQVTIDELGLPLLGAATQLAALANDIGLRMNAIFLEMQAEFEAALANADVPRGAGAITVMERQTTDLEARFESEGGPLLEVVNGIGKQLTAIDRQ